MKKKVGLFCLFVVLTFLTTSLASGFHTVPQPLTAQDTVFEEQASLIQEKQKAVLGTAFLLIYVLTFTQGEGLKACQGANITVKSLLHTYNATTDERGIHVFPVHTALLREKFFFIKVSIVSEDEELTKTALIRMKSRQIMSKGFLFII